MEHTPLLITDLDALHRKLENPPAGLDVLVERFERQMTDDAAFRHANLYLSALLGDADALERAKEQVLASADGFSRRGAEDNTIEHHTWCVAPHALRTAVYHSWLAVHGCWSDGETKTVAQGLLHFAEEHAVNTLRGRVPAADNQSFSMALTCAIIGYAFRNVPAVAARASALHDYGRFRMEKVLGLAPNDGYMGEGSTYQSHVVSPLAMWATAFLMQCDNPTTPACPWAPTNTTLHDILRVEALLGSPGLLLPPWDNYGWQHTVNLAATALWSRLTGDLRPLRHAAEIWDRPSYIAWDRDDRMWALIFWPDAPLPADTEPVLGGWTLPHTAATLDHAPARMRLMCCWDACSSALQGLTRAQVNPNHLMFEVNGVPITGDGSAAGPKGFLPVSIEEITAPLNDDQQALVARQYGSVANWAVGMQGGLLGAANTVVVDDAYGYFPPAARQGQLVGEERGAERHVVTAESVAYFHPEFDLTRARRTIAMCASGLSWIVDDYRAPSVHTYTWQLYLRHGGTLRTDGLSLLTADKQQVALAWLPGTKAGLHTVATFPRQDEHSALCWPEAGSERLHLRIMETEARFVVALLPGVDQLTVRAVDDNTWEARWPGGSETFHLPAFANAPVTLAPVTPETLDDLDDLPFALSDDPTPALLAALQAPDACDWRRTVVAMQTLTVREIPEALPAIHVLLRDGDQRYHIHSVAAWCLGRAAYHPALDDLRALSNSPETNTATHARFAVERISYVHR